MLLLAASGTMEWIDKWFNYPGLELWKFFNLAIFITLMTVGLRRKISEGLVARRETIRRELLKAQEERQRALEQLGEAEALLSRLHDDVRSVREHAEQEAQAERRRLASGTEAEIQKLKAQAEREIETAGKVARKRLRQFLASRSIELARQSVVSQMSSDDDLRIVKNNIGELGRSRG
jgi:F0F1-type ATP synthase membrane subunit b/b'